MSIMWFLHTIYNMKQLIWECNDNGNQTINMHNIKYDGFAYVAQSV